MPKVPYEKSRAGQIEKMLRETEMTYFEISQKIGCQRQYVGVVAQRCGISKPQLPVKQNEIVQLLKIKPELSLEEIAKRAKSHRGYVHNVAKMHGFETKRVRGVVEPPKTKPSGLPIRHVRPQDMRHGR